MENNKFYEAIIIGAGHAGVESALSLARKGHKTLLLTISLDAISFMACNPSIGGTAKGHLVCEIDALGGEMGFNADLTSLQEKTLNTSRGPAVQATRAQCDKKEYKYMNFPFWNTGDEIELKVVLENDRFFLRGFHKKISIFSWLEI